MRIGENQSRINNRLSTVERKTRRGLELSGLDSELWTVNRQLGFTGFTLLELMIVITLILILASIAFPTYHVAVVRAREAVLRDDLYTMRKLIDEFTLDKRRAPQSLDELVEEGYLRGGAPTDPFTGRNDSWRVDTEDVPIAGDQPTSGIVDVHSGSDEPSLDGTPYSSW